MIKWIAAATVLAAPALAQSPGQPADKPMAMSMLAAAAADSPSTTAYRHAMQTMMTGMNAPYSGDADRDFVTGMLPHHQGAIDMAKIELQYGHDPALRRLARDIIGAQAKERAFMHRWLAEHPAQAPTPQP
jgi:uncharacterized protein (DUF305 family)